MRTAHSRHSEPVREPHSYFWRNGNCVYRWRPTLNLEALAQLLRITIETPHCPKGKKRAASPSPPHERRHPKRSRGSASRTPSPEWNGDELDESGIAFSGDNVNLHIPHHRIPESSADSSEGVPVYRHIFEVEFTQNALSEFEDAVNDASAEERFLALLEERYGSILEPTTVDLGNIFFIDVGARLAARSYVLGDSSIINSNEQWLVLVPSINAHFDQNGSDYMSDVQDVLLACLALKDAGRLNLQGNLQFIALPEGIGRKSYEFPFRLQIEITVSLRLPNIFEPIFSVRTSRRKLTALEDAQRRVLTYIFPSNRSMTELPSYTGETNIPFFYSILNPAPRLTSIMAEDSMQPDALRPSLLPFQRRSVAWLLEREGKTVTCTGQIVSKSESTTALPLSWVKIERGEKPPWYLHELTGFLSLEAPTACMALGGILAEEPGLGKTLECIALILLNPSPGRNPSVKRWDEEAGIEVQEIKTTLIVTPVSLASQWADEIALHAPTLKVLIYKGWSTIDAERARERGKPKGGNKRTKTPRRKSAVNGKGKGKRKARSKWTMDSSDDEMDLEEPTGTAEDFDWCSYINKFDVCITTYSVLRSDFNVARVPPVRPRREDVKYSSAGRPRSPLVMCEWLRVIMDEVQMAGGRNTETMVSLIPRVSSFAVSGTPARAQVADLIHLLKFLRIDGLVGHSRLWNRLQKPGFAPFFASLFNQYAIRTMKATVKDELTIPQQNRYLVSVELGPVEKHVYDQAFEATLLELGLDARGVAVSDGWQVDSTLLRTSLRRLRGICTHPQVGQLQKLRDKLFKLGALKSMAEVLEAMKDQNWRNFMDDRKSRIQSLLRSSQLQQRVEADPNRYQHSLETLLLAEKDANVLIEDVKSAIADHDVKGEELKKEAAARKETYENHNRQDLTSEADASPTLDKGKGKVPEKSPSPASDGLDSEDHDLPRTPAGEEHGIKKRALQHRLRECFVTLHRVKFLQGDVYHVLGASHGPDEDAAYASAEEIRRILLQTTEESANRAMTQLTHAAAAKGITEKILQIPVPYCGQGGILSADLMDEANEIIEDLLNKQSALLWEWRMKIYGLLTQKLAAGDDEADGEEYARTLDTQGEAESYLQAYAALLADRREVLVAERTLLAAHDAREKKLRHTKAAMKAAAAAVATVSGALGDLEIPEDIELQPEHEALHKDLSKTRKELLLQFNGRAVKSVMIDLTAIAIKIRKDDDPEKIIAKDGAARLRQLMNAQGEVMDKLDADLTLFRKAFNERILYFRQLQEISDSVAEVEWDGYIVDAIQACQVERNELEARVNTGRARQRYLNYLAKNKEDGSMEDNDDTCVLCKCDFTRGFITQCAHVFCEECMKLWVVRKHNTVCPVCRKDIIVEQMQRFSLGEDSSQQPPAQLINGEPAPKSRREIRYNTIDPQLLKDIETVESHGSYGNKIQSLVRHLLYLQLTDPGAKSIVFSAWADSLHIIEHALVTNGIPCIRIDQSRGTQNAAKSFRNTPNILVLLLHGERENAGLNITCASRVFLVESVVHHGFEIQAIARIDRMGQTRPTEVYCYYAEDTVERNILDLAARQGLSLYTKNNSAGTLDVAAFTTDIGQKRASFSMKKKMKGDFIFSTEDMLAILFPHMFEELEYLLPEDQLMEVDDEPNLQVPQSSDAARIAVAGPSRLA